MKILNLGNNIIKEVQPGLFSKLPLLEELYFKANKIEELNENVFDRLDKLKILNLGNNIIKEAWFIKIFKAIKKAFFKSK